MNPTQAKLRTCYMEGQSAFGRGLPVTANPYQGSGADGMDCPYRRRWNAGWLYAEALEFDRNRRKRT